MTTRVAGDTKHANAAGYDAPCGAADDRLGRRAFAYHVAKLATDSRPEWSVRIGVYGAWGTGKTTVLRMVQERVEASGHIALILNPWGSTSSDSMWSALVVQLHEVLKARKLDSEAAQFASLLGRMQQVLGFGHALAEDAGGEKVARRIGTFLSKMLRPTKEDIRGIVRGTENRRVIVLVDDLDRADPRLVPELLHTFKEVLDLPGLSFVMFLDPTAVGRALAAYHPGWGDAELFLQKIVDFPRHLPAVTREDVRRLVRAEFDQRLPDVPATAIDSVLPLLSENPRMLRGFVRHAWAADAALRRIGATALDWRVALRAVLLEQEFPGIARELLQGDLLARVVASKFATGPRHGTDDVRQELSLSSWVYKRLDAEQQSRAVRLVDELGSSPTVRQGASIGDYIALLIAPPPLTRAEVTLIADSCSTGSEVDERLGGQAEASGAPVVEVRRLFWEHLTSEYQTRLGEAAGSRAGYAQGERVRDAQRILTLLASQVHHFRGASPALDLGSFKAALSRVLHYHHFRGQAYVALREGERGLLEQITRDEAVPPEMVLRALVRKGEGAQDPLEAPKHDLYRALRGIAEERFATTVPERIAEDGFADDLLYSKEKKYLRWAVLRPAAVIWRGTARLGILTAFRSPAAPRALGECALALLRAMGDPERFPDAIGLRDDCEIVTALWDCGMRERVNPRFFTELNALRQLLSRPESVLGEPDWWALVAQEAAAIQGQPTGGPIDAPPDAAASGALPHDPSVGPENGEQ